VCEQVSTAVKEAALGAQRRIPQLCPLRDLVGEQAVFVGAAGAALATARKSGQATSSVMACRLSLLILPRLLSARLSGLRTLNLSSGPGSLSEWSFLLNDDFVATFPSCPQLAALIVRNVDLTDKGITHLARSCRGLISFDFTFCNRATYSAVVSVRQLCPHIQLIRRQPEEFDGRFGCPWGEEHSYYADGSFAFTREVESMGWVCFLHEHLGDLNQGSFFTDRLRSTPPLSHIPPETLPHPKTQTSTPKP